MNEQFVSTTRGSINLRFVRRVYDRQQKRPDGTWIRAWFAVDVDGESYELFGEPEELLPVVPALQPMWLVEVWIWEDEAQHVRLPIVAWRIHPSGWLEPLAPSIDDPGDNERHFIELPDGKYLETGNEQIYDNLEACEKYTRENMARMEEIKAAIAKSKAAKAESDDPGSSGE